MEHSYVFTAFPKIRACWAIVCLGCIVGFR